MTSDTTPDAQARFDAILRSRSGSDRVIMACEMFELARALMAARLKELEPNIDRCQPAPSTRIHRPRDTIKRTPCAMTNPLLERDQTLAQIVGRLVEAYEPERIYLFGSQARGDAGPDSDYDLLIVAPDDAPAEQRDSKLAYEVLWGVAASVDAVVCSSSWFHARTHLKASLPGTVLREGRLLHAA